MNNDANSLVNDLLNILQPDIQAEESKEKNVEKKAETTVKATIIQKKGGKITQIVAESKPSIEAEKDVPPRTDRVKKEVFLDGIDETVKNTQNAKVVIRKDLYEVFMSIKRAKQVKSVSTLLDHALEDYIKRHSENIKKLLYDSKNHGIL